MVKRVARRANVSSSGGGGTGIVNAVANVGPDANGNVDLKPSDLDAYTSAQTDDAIDNQFATAALATADGNDYLVDMRDTTKSDGYGLNNDIITYFSPTVGLQTFDINYGKWFFIHDKINATTGYHVMHKSLFPTQLQNNELIFFQLGGNAKCSLGKFNQLASSFSNPNARWNSNGRLIPINIITNANNQNPLVYLNGNGNVVNNYNQSQTATYSTGPVESLGPGTMQRGNVNYIDDNTDTTFVADNNSDFFVWYGTAGGGTFSTKKIYQVFPRDYTRFFYMTTTSAIALGVKVALNEKKIRQLDQFTSDELLDASVATKSLYTLQLNVGA